jgi:hypothetical protein
MGRSFMVYGLILLFGATLCSVAAAGDGSQQKAVCEDAGLVGAAYAACNRYCSALDCDADQPNGNSRACDQALDRFVELTGEWPPCEPLCPCASGWLNDDFVPEYDVTAECNIEVSDIGKRFELQIAGESGKTGEPQQSFANLEINNDEFAGFFRVGCFSERVVGDPGELTEDSGGFELLTNFKDPSSFFELQQRRVFRSCKRALNRIFRQNEIECTVVDVRED